MTGIQHHPKLALLLTGGVDWTTKLWSPRASPTPLMSLTSGIDSILDVQWCVCPWASAPTYMWAVGRGQKTLSCVCVGKRTRMQGEKGRRGGGVGRRGSWRGKGRAPGTVPLTGTGYPLPVKRRCPTNLGMFALIDTTGGVEVWDVAADTEVRAGPPIPLPPCFHCVVTHPTRALPVPPLARHRTCLTLSINDTPLSINDAPLVNQCHPLVNQCHPRVNQ